MSDDAAPSLRTVGVLGGMSSQSTVEYYRLIDARINETLGGHNAGELLIRSVNFAEIERCIRAERWDDAAALLTEAALELEAGGAEFVVLATNTMHRVAPQLTDALSVPFCHIVDATADAVTAAGIDTVGVLGTRPVMEADFYRDRFAAHDIDVVVPGRDPREAVDRVIFEELTRGEVRDASRALYLEVIDELVDAGAEGVVLGCTEIDLLVEQDDCPETPLFDTTALHVERAVDRCLDVDASPR